MRWRKCIILKHITSQGSHYDWLMENPAGDSFSQQPLWTARVNSPPAHWLAARRLVLTPLPEHRRIYLTYQGPVSGRRGHVIQIARGRVLPLQWSAGSCHLLIHWQSPLPPMHVHLLSPQAAEDASRKIIAAVTDASPIHAVDA